MKEIYQNIGKTIQILRSYKLANSTKEDELYFLQKCHQLKKLIKKTVKYGGKLKKIKPLQRINLVSWSNEISSICAQIKRFRKTKEAGRKKKKKIIVRDSISAFDRRIDTKILINHGYELPDEFLLKCANKVVNIISKKLQKFNGLKVYFVFMAIYDINEEIETKSMISKTTTILKHHWLENDERKHLKLWYMEEFYPKMMGIIDEFHGRGSNYVLRRILNLTVNLNVYDPLSGGTYFKLSAKIENKKAVINVQNRDDFCFLWSIMAHIYPEVLQKKNQYISKELEQKVVELFEEYFPNYSSLFEFPMKVDKIKKFEKTYPNFSINVYTMDLEDRYIVPCYLTSKERQNYHIHLFLARKYDDESKEYLYHYCLVKNLNRFVASQIQKCHVKLYICERCVNCFYSDETYAMHEKICVATYRTILPEPPRNIMKFKDFHHKLMNSLVCYADSETLLKPCQENELIKGSYQKHNLFSIGIYLRNRFEDEKSYYTVCSGENVLDQFFHQLKYIAEIAENVSKNS